MIYEVSTTQYVACYRYATYRVVASSLDEAEEKVLQGEGEPIAFSFDEDRELGEESVDEVSAA